MFTSLAAHFAYLNVNCFRMFELILAIYNRCDPLGYKLFLKQTGLLLVLPKATLVFVNALVDIVSRAHDATKVF